MTSEAIQDHDLKFDILGHLRLFESAFIIQLSTFVKHLEPYFPILIFDMNGTKMPYHYTFVNHLEASFLKLVFNMLGTIFPPIWNYFHKSIRILTTQDDQLDKNLINKNLISKFFLVFQEFLGLYKNTLVFL